MQLKWNKPQDPVFLPPKKSCKTISVDFYSVKQKAMGYEVEVKCIFMWPKWVAISWKLSFARQFIEASKMFLSNLCNYILKLQLDVFMLSEFSSLKYYWQQTYWFYCKQKTTLSLIFRYNYQEKTQTQHHLQ